MEIILKPQQIASYIYYREEGFRYNRPLRIEIGQKDRWWYQAFCHELGHAYTTLNKIKKVKDETPHESMKVELLAWRFAKSFCKKKYWSEKEALRCLEAYATGFNYKVNVSKLKIIPLNTNKWLIDELRGGINGNKSKAIRNY